MNILLEGNYIILQLNTETKFQYNLKNETHIEYLFNFSFGLINIINAYINKKSYCSTITLPYTDPFHSNKIVFSGLSGIIIGTIHQYNILDKINEPNILLDNLEIVLLLRDLLSIYKGDYVYNILKDKDLYYKIIEIGDNILCNLGS